MNKTTVTKLKQRLVAEERYLVQELDTYATEQQFISQSASEEHASSVDDAGAEMFEHEKALAIEGTLEEILADVEHALHKVDDASYGVCDACGQPIDPERLEAAASQPLPGLQDPPGACRPRERVYGLGQGLTAQQAGRTGMYTTAEWPVATLAADIGLARIEDPEAIASLWERCGGRTSPGTAAPAREIVAREHGTGRVIGVAEFIRTFPPEDVLASVCVDPAFRRRRIGRMLLEALIISAAEQGRRDLCGFISEANVAAWKLLESSGAPSRVYETDGGYYVELDTMRDPSPEKLL